MNPDTKFEVEEAESSPLKKVSFLPFKEFQNKFTDELFLKSALNEYDFKWLEQVFAGSEEDSRCIIEENTLYFFTDKPLNHGFNIPLIFPGKSFDVNENHCHSMLESSVLKGSVIRTMWLSKEWKSLFNWCYFADGAKGYCFGYRFEDIKKAICQKLSSFKGNFVCVYGSIDYGDHSNKELFPFPAQQLRNYVDSVFLKNEIYKPMSGFAFLILGIDSKIHGLESIAVKPVSCSVVVKGETESEIEMNILGLEDLEDRQPI